jgi:hypothetical protein
LISVHLKENEFILEQNKKIISKNKNLPLDIRNANFKVIIYFECKSTISSHVWKEKFVLTYSKQNSDFQRSGLY